MDHIEASVASNVHYFRQGLALYPSPDSFTFHGLLYGPLLVELNSLGYLIPAGGVSAKVVGWIAAWAALTAIWALSRHKSSGWAGMLGAAYAICLLVAFGGELTNDRSEPVLLLSAAVSLLIARDNHGFGALALLGALCGAQAALKLHAPIYCAPALYLWCAGYPSELWRKNYLLIAAVFAVTATCAALLPFLPANVSLAGYHEYLTLAVRHGMNARLFLLNSAFVLGSWGPLWVLLGNFTRVRVLSTRLQRFALTLFVAECLVVVVASKP